MNKIFQGIFPILFIMFFNDVSAQTQGNIRNGAVSPWEIGLSGGVTTFITSISPDGGTSGIQINYWQRELNPGIGLSLVRNISPSMGIEINWLNTKLTGTWKTTRAPLPISAGHEVPLTFKSLINQFDLMVAFNVNQIIHPGYTEDRWHLFLKTGVGYTHIKDTKDFFPGSSPYTKFSLAVDAGASFSINEKLKLLVGSTFRSVNTDNLDGVHVDATDANGQPVSNLNVFEIYNYTYLRLNYRIGDRSSKRSKILFRNIKGNSGICR